MAARNRGNTTVYRSSKLPALLIMLGITVFVVPGTVPLLSDEPATEEVLTNALLSTLVLVLGLIPLVKEFILPELTLTDSGFTHRRTGSYAWAEVTRIRFRKMGPLHLLEVLLWHPEASLERAPWHVQQLGRAMRRRGYSPVTIPALTLTAPLTEVAAAMRRHHPDLSVG
ncbi:hypothetical protein [Nocardia crassostreae]|uniref:hypothetical protein n=1 Tax=Nocardia crassostreae TaxID=53428 RepID=UPI000A8A66EF|nr:hypothetical protein [Nocardia crassostreae]